jgi:hypothetical protein
VTAADCADGGDVAAVEGEGGGVAMAEKTSEKAASAELIALSAFRMLDRGDIVTPFQHAHQGAINLRPYVIRLPLLSVTVQLAPLIN